ncbi:hypothetical protein TRICHSKD4_2984 [Roseibium sp. TrichSKD4]|nr:hypothetical protein TRICHSKD4_2984 [Roseibium sp. TrichSKD4]
MCFLLFGALIPENRIVFDLSFPRYEESMRNCVAGAEAG